MPITPEQARQEEIKKASSIINRVCDEIDNTLAAGDRKYDIDGLTSLVLSEVSDKFKAAGWRIEVKSNDKCHYFLFSPDHANDK